MFKTIIFVLLFSSFADAANVTLGANIEGRFSQEEDSQWQLRAPYGIFVGYHLNPWGILLEGSFDKETTHSGSSFSITDNQYELTAYAYNLLSYVEGRVVNPYVIGGFGARQDRVTTRFAGDSETDHSKIYGTIKAGGGLWMQFLSKSFMMLEGKAMYSAAYTPNIIFGLTLRLGYEF
jgi:hypothetical protein